EKTTYYEFEASTRKEIWQQILAKSPKGATEIAGHHAVNVATTEWQMKARYGLEGGFQKCTLTDVQPHLRITIRLPLWTNKWEADAVLADNWDNYVRMVSRHEDVHRQYAIRMASEYETALMQLGSARTCKELREDIDKAWQKVVGEFNAKNNWFDAQEFVYQKELVWF
ncbi:MAG TPA: DUF922 domain-containing protein, partial [Dongiaceae bacterium]|nr:DUF922 domain-containing protein [Dongiaceae bacterium]